jgi:hypothetical protein
MCKQAINGLLKNDIYQVLKNWFKNVRLSQNCHQKTKEDEEFILFVFI